MNLDATFAALADPTRRAIVAQLALGEKSIMELAAPFCISQPAISRHIKVLQEAGLIVRRIEGTKRPCRLAPEAIVQMEAWLELMRSTLESNYQRLDLVLAQMSSKKPKKGRGK